MSIRTAAQRLAQQLGRRRQDLLRYVTPRRPALAGRAARLDAGVPITGIRGRSARRLLPFGRWRWRLREAGRQAVRSVSRIGSLWRGRTRTATRNLKRRLGSRLARIRAQPLLRRSPQAHKAGRAPRTTDRPALFGSPGTNTQGARLRFGNPLPRLTALIRRQSQASRQALVTATTWLRTRPATALAALRRARETCDFCKEPWGFLRRLKPTERPRLVPGLIPGRGKTEADPRDQRLQFEARDYPGSRNRYYHLHLPPQANGRRPLPLVLVLHGCRQTDAQIRQISNMDAIADQAGFIAVYPWVTAYSGLRTRNCWGWWYSNEIRAGEGEVEDLWQIIEEVCARYPVDRSRIHVTGLSSGGGMTVAMLVAHGRRIASGAVVAGVPYAENASAVSLSRRSRGIFKPIEKVAASMTAAMGERPRTVPVFIAHSHDDETVNLRAAENIRDSWAAAFRLSMSRRSVRQGSTQGTPWEHIRYRDDNRRSIIETFFISGHGHGWYGGHPGPYSYPEAPNLSKLIWEFFDSHPL